MTTNTPITDGGWETKSDTPRTILFPDVRLDEVLNFEDELLLALRATKSWQDPATPSWLGSALCALTTAIGPMVRLFLPDGLTVTPNFNTIIAIPAGGSFDLNRRLLEPIRNLQSCVRERGKIPLENILTSSFKDEDLRYQFPRAINGGLVIANPSTALLDVYRTSDRSTQDFIALTLHDYVVPKRADTLAKPSWEGSLNMLMFGRREQLPDLATTLLFHPEKYPNILVLPEAFVPLDISYGHEFGFMEQKPWNDFIKKMTGFPNFRAFRGNHKIDCSTESAVPLEDFRKELDDILKVIHPAYRPFLKWLPDLAAKIALTICFAQNPEVTSIGREQVQHAVTITKWLANCHLKGLQEILQVEPLPDIPDSPAIPDRPRLILEKLRTKGPMRPREISRSCYQLTASARDFALHWLQERNLVVFRPDGRVQAVN